MKELTNSCCLQHVSGGSGWIGANDCPICNEELSNEKSDTAQVIGNAAGTLIGQRIGTAIGGMASPIGAVAGAYIGNEIGKFIDTAIATNYLPPLGDDSILLDYIKNEQPW
ncbi:hypothetical protein ACERCG_08625 [Mannheimia sp. E30BD]|uniref:hypothetical protein n=1 Tax=Mannheimia sp. E30BD TaxID=3278708 RepID=UPI00359EA1BE